jgi:hypothetical protein
MRDLSLNPRVKKLLDNGVDSLDIMHGELKNLMVEAEAELEAAIEEEERTEEAMDSMERKYWEGQLDALSIVYALTYKLSFAREEK